MADNLETTVVVDPDFLQTLVDCKMPKTIVSQVKSVAEAASAVIVAAEIEGELAQIPITARPEATFSEIMLAEVLHEDRLSAALLEKLFDFAPEFATHDKKAMLVEAFRNFGHTDEPR